MKQKHLPVIGVGPLYVVLILLTTVLALFLEYKGYLRPGKVPVLKYPFMLLGILLIVGGLFLWYKAVFSSNIDQHIRENKLVTTGVYAWVRNPIYSAFMLLSWGLLLLAYNLYLILVMPLYWLFMSMMMKYTEEKWLKELYQEEYLEYCKRVNRCIPWFPKNK